MLNRGLLLLLFAVAITGCDNYAMSSKSTDAAIGPETEDAVMCAEPENPYNDDGGHDAGYKWAEENGEPCGGDSDSFNQGCATYYEQRQRYEECLARRRK